MDNNIVDKENAERLFYDWQLGQTGKFHTYLISAMMIADSKNINALKSAFPELVKVVLKYHNESNYWYALCKKYKI